MRHYLLILIAAAVGFTTTLARAQSGPALMLKPWAEGKHVELSIDTYYFDDGHTDRPRGSHDFDLNIFDVEARVNPDPAADVLRFGMEMTYLDIDSNDPRIPSRLVDQSVGVGFGITKFDSWEIGAVVGVGYAGNNPFADSDAIYGEATLIASYKIDDSSSLQLMLNYDGNRSIFPDVPLPAVAYNHRISDKLWYTVGLPFSTIHWVPIERLTIDVSYGVPVSVTGTIDFEFVDFWHVYGSFKNRMGAFHIDGEDDTRRLFFRQRRVETGLRWELKQLSDTIDAELIVAGGYAFDQEFESGFDVRDLSSVRDLSDEPYLRVGLNVRF